MQEVLKIQEEKYFITIQSDKANLTITVMQQKQYGQAEKLQASIDIQKDMPQLYAFQNARNIVKLLQNSQNYLYEPSQKKFVILWRIQGTNFCQSISTKICLKNSEMTKLEKLQFENQMLKKAIQKYQKNQINYSSIENEKKNNQSECVSISQKLRYADIKIENVELPIANEQVENQQQKGQIHEQSELKDEMQQLKVQKCKLIHKNKRMEKKKKKDRNKADKETSSARITRNSQKLNGNKYLFDIKLPGVKKQKKKETEKKEMDEKTDTGGIQKSIKSRNKYSKRIKDEQLQNKTCIIGDKIRIDYRNGDYYLGQVSNNKYHGIGIYFSNQNGTYEGEWVNGMAEGEGIATDKIGNKYVGKFKNDMKNGYGVQTYKNGEVYKGQFVNDEKEGKGIYYFLNGNVYCGDWKSGQPNGIGQETYSCGGFYIGTWKNNKKHKEGVYEYACGKKKKQVWQNGKIIFQTQASK